MVSKALELIPITIGDAENFVEQHHRHHDPDTGARFAVAVAQASDVVGVAIVGNPKARMLNDGWTAEVTRVCCVELERVTGSDGREHTAGAVAMLYGACWRAARALGYRRLVTYTLPEEGRASLRGAGWKLSGEDGGGS